MRALALAAVAISVVLAAWLLVRGPRPSTAQIGARATADSLTRARLAAFERGEFGVWSTMLRSDALLIAADPAGVHVGPGAAAAEMMKDLAPEFARGLVLEITPERVTTGATRRGRMAWAAAALDYRSRLGRDSLRVPFRHSAVYLQQEGEWRVMLEHDARVMTWDELRDGARGGRFPAPAALAAPQGRGAQSLADRFKRWLPHLTRGRPDRDALAIGPGGEMAAGDSAVRAMLGDWERRLGPPQLAAGGITAWAPRNRDVGWVAANLVVSPPEWGGVTLPLRFTGLYRESGEDSWKLALAHLSVGVPDAADTAAAVGLGAGR